MYIALYPSEYIDYDTSMTSVFLLASFSFVSLHFPLCNVCVPEPQGQSLAL